MPPSSCIVEQRHGVDADGRRGEQPRGDHPVQQPDRRGQPRAEHQREAVAGDRVDPCHIHSAGEPRRGEPRQPACAARGGHHLLVHPHPGTLSPGAAPAPAAVAASAPCPRLPPVVIASRPSSTPSPPGCSSVVPGGPRPRERSWPSTTRPPARRSSRSPTPPPTTGGPRSTPPSPPSPASPRMPPRERGEILRRAFDLIMSRIDDLALLMTLEMGKPMAESKGEIAYAAEFFRWFAEEAVRIDGQYAVAPNGASRFLVMRQPVGVVPAGHPVELPDGHGHPQDRPGGRRRLHDGDQARAADPAVDARPRRDPRRGGPARRGAQRRDDLQRRARSWSR